MLIHINRADSWEKENKAPKFFSNIQPRKKIDYRIAAKPSNKVLESKIIVKSSNCHTPGAPQKKFMMEHDMLFAPKSIDFSNEGKTFEDEYCGGNPLLFSKHAWTAQSPSSDAKCHNGSSLPVLNGTNITVDSPDPTSKFYSKSPPCGYSADPDSPEPEDLFRAMCDIANISSPEPGSMKRRRSTTVITPENVHHSNSSSSSAESESLPFVSSNNVTIVTTPDPHTKFHAVASSSRSRPIGYNSMHGVSQGRVAPRLLRLQIDHDDKSSMGSTIRQARRPSFNSESNIKMSEKEDIFTKSMSPFKQDYDVVITKLRSSGNTKETVKTPLKNFSPSAARNPENHLSIDNFHEFEDYIEDESSIRKEDSGTSSFSSTIRNQNFVHQSINGISRRNMSENMEISTKNQNQYHNQISKTSLSASCTDPEGIKHDFESMSFIRDLRRRKSEINISIENHSTSIISAVRRSSDDTFDSPKGRDKENKTLKEKRNAAMENFSDKECTKEHSKEHSNIPKRVIRPSPPLLPLKSRNDIKLRYDRLQPVGSGSGSQGDSSSHPGSSYNYRGQGVSAPTQFVKNGRTYRNVDPAEGFTPQIISPTAVKPATNRNHTEEHLLNRDITDCREVKDKEKEKDKEKDKENDKEKEKERKEVRIEIRTSPKVSNMPTRSKEQIAQVPPPKTSISPTHNKRSVPKYFDEESIVPSVPRSPEFENLLRSPTSDNIYIDERDETHRPAKIRISTAAVTQMYVRTKNAKKKKRSLSYYLIRGVSLESVPEDEELVNFVEYQQVKTRRGATVSDLMKQLKKIF